MLYSLDSRCQEILQYLIYADRYVTVQEISREKNISRRSVYYDICKINDWLEAHDIEPIVIERKKGIFVTEEYGGQISTLLKNMSENSMYLFSPMERVKIIICTILKRNQPVFIETFINLCQVSRNTIISDLKVVTAKLQETDLNLVYEHKDGYRIQGDVIRKRSIFFLMFADLADLYKKQIVPLDDDEKVKEIYGRLHQIEQELEADYVSGILFSIAVFFSSINSRREELVFSIRDKMEISRTKEYKLVCKYFGEFNEGEQYYLSLHLLGSRLQTIPINLMKSSDKEAYTLAKALVSEFSRIACIEFGDTDEIEQALFAHLKTSLYRYRYGIQLGNPMLDDIKTQYTELFEITKKACEYLEQQIGVPIPDGEVAYLTLHFGGYIEGRHTVKRFLSILIVCPNGISTGNMLRKEVRTLIPQARKIDVISLSQYRLDNNYDVTISTVAIDGARDLIIVHPILTDNDRVLILRKCMKNEDKYSPDMQAILDLAKGYMTQANLDLFKADLTRYFASLNTKIVKQKTNYGYGLLNYIDENHIVITDKQIDWEKSVQFIGQKLIEENCIEPRYIDAIIEKCKHFGPYMFITDDIVLAHAKIEDGALKLGVNMGIFHKPVVFAPNRKARIMIFLVAVDQESHLKILNDIMAIFSDRSNTDKIAQCTQSVQAVKMIADILNVE